MVQERCQRCPFFRRCIVKLPKRHIKIYYWKTSSLMGRRLPATISASPNARRLVWGGLFSVTNYISVVCDLLSLTMFQPEKNLPALPTSRLALPLSVFVLQGTSCLTVLLSCVALIQGFGFARNVSYK